MKCKDCEREVDKLSKEGLCDYCKRRQYNCKMRDKEYYPIKDLKGTKEYKFFENRFLKDTEEKVDVDITLKEETQQPNEAMAIVAKDVEKAFEEKNISKDYLNVDLNSFIETFFGLFQEDSLYEDTKKAAKVFDYISSDYLHYMENSEWGSEDAEKYMRYEKALLELRRPTKNKLGEYEILEPIIEYLNNEYFQNLLEEAREKLIKLSNADKTYKLKLTNVKNDLNMERKFKKYRTSVTCWNLYGQRGADTFERDFLARNEEDAKAKLIDFIEGNFDSLVYNKEDIKVELLEREQI